LPKDLLASELFGYERGAFTGAKRQGHPSKFEMANRGTLLLDEVSEMIPEAQIYLLRVIEERMVTRLGGTTNIPVDVRIIAASNRDLQELVDQGLFRMDLFYRLNVIRLDLPPLRVRRGDVRLLAEHFLNILAGSRGAAIRGFAPGLLEALETYHWPGNVRELRNTIEQAMVVCEGDYISFEDLPSHLRQALAIPERISPEERDRYFNFIKTYQELDGNISKIARALKVSRPTIYAWREKYGLGEGRN
jgi:transcriptional regulator with PAS, ATPase and Fis domain